jgi:hypothetical protein
MLAIGNDEEITRYRNWEMSGMALEYMYADRAYGNLILGMRRGLCYWPGSAQFGYTIFI